MTAALPTPDGPHGLVDELRRSVRGELHLPGDPGYDRHRRVWNGAIDRRPAAIIRPRGPSVVADVTAAVRAGAARGLPVAVRGGGHNVAGLGTCDGGIVIDLAHVRSVTVDPVRRTALVGGGATWGDVDAATARHGLATTGGQVSTTGVGGLTLGGGIGWLARPHGLACDNLRRAHLVRADGTAGDVDAAVDEALFWALRGGGGNFGAVTALTLALHPVDTVLGGQLLFPLARGVAVLRAVRDIALSAPDGFTMSAGFWTPPGGEACSGVALCHVGDVAQAASALAQLRALRPSYDDVAVQPYPQMQRIFDEGSPPGERNAAKGEYLAALPDDAVDALHEEGNRLPSALSQVLVTHLGGAIARVAESETAFGHRRAPFLINVLALWSDPALDDGFRAWTRRVRERMLPWSTGGVYVNFLEEEGAERVAQAYAPDVLARLVEVKTRVDPGNVFRINQNIVPAG